MTAPICVAGGICLQILKSKGICIGAHLSSVYDINDDSFNRTDIREDELLQISGKSFPVINDEKGKLMKISQGEVSVTYKMRFPK